MFLACKSQNQFINIVTKMMKIKGTVFRCRCFCFYCNYLMPFVKWIALENTASVN